MVKLQPTKKTKINQVQWHGPVIPATQEAEAGELFESGGAEAAMTWESTTALQPGQQTEIPSQKKN